MALNRALDVGFQAYEILDTTPEDPKQKPDNWDWSYLF